MATVVPYHTSVYGFNFGVHPKYRRMGLGRRIMHEGQAYALSLGLRQVSATVDVAQPRLLQYYLNLGGRVVSQGESNGLVCVPVTRPTGIVSS